MHNHRTIRRLSQNIPVVGVMLLMFYAGSNYGDTVDPDLTLLPISPAMLATEDALLTDQPSAVVSFVAGRRPYSNNSIWNTRADNAFYSPVELRLHQQSDQMVKFMAETVAYTNASTDPAACDNLPSGAKIRFANTYVSPLHIVDSTDDTILAYVKGEPRSKSPIYNQWDTDGDFWLDYGRVTPLYKWENGIQKKLWGEPESDGHIVVVDPNSQVSAGNTELFDPPLSGVQYGRVWEMSQYHSFAGRYCGSVTNAPCSWGIETYLGNAIERATVSTYTAWSLSGKGYGNLPTHDNYPGTATATFWQHFGGKGSGASILGGMLRLAEFNNKTVNHALAFSFPMNRTGVLNSGTAAADPVETFVYPPGTRSDGQFLTDTLPVGDNTSYNVAYCQQIKQVANPYGSTNPVPYPLEGVRLRLKSSYVHPYKTAAGTVGRQKMEHLISILKNYGMFLTDSGGPMALEIELLAAEPAVTTSTSTKLAGNANANAWLAQSGVDVYAEIKQIPVTAFEVLDYGLQAINPNTGNTAPITGKPYMMSDNLGNAQSCCWKNYPNP